MFFIIGRQMVNYFFTTASMWGTFRTSCKINYFIIIIFSGIASNRHCFYTRLCVNINNWFQNQRYIPLSICHNWYYSPQKYFLVCFRGLLRGNKLEAISYCLYLFRWSGRADGCVEFISQTVKKVEEKTS